MMHKTRSRAMVALAVLALVVSIPIFADAQTPEGTTTTSVAPTPATESNPALNTWSVSPTGQNPAEPSERPNFSYELAPGTGLHDSATVWNYSDEQRTFDIYARDAFNSPQGGIDLLTKDNKQSTGVGSWIKFEQERVTVPPKAGATMPFTINVPLNVTPGDHDGGITAELVTATSENEADQRARALVAHRVGLRVYLRVPGPLNPTLVIDEIDSTYNGVLNPVGRGEVTVTYTVRNAGNIRLKANRALKVTGPFGLTLAEGPPAEIPELLPGASMSRTETLVGVFPALRVSAEVTVTPTPVAAIVKGSGPPPPETTTRTASVWAVPWTLLAMLALMIAGLRWLRRARRSRGPRSPKAKTTSPEADEVDDFDWDIDEFLDDADDQVTIDLDAKNVRSDEAVFEHARLETRGVVKRVLRAAGAVVIIGASAVGPVAGAGAESTPVGEADSTSTTVWEPPTTIDTNPTLRLDKVTAAEGEIPVARLTGWPAGPVTIAVCGNIARRGSQDCDITAAQAVGVPVEGSIVARVPINATPPIGCPCVVRVQTSSNSLVRTVLIVLPHVPYLKPEEVPPDPFSHATPEELEVEARFDNTSDSGQGVSAFFGGPLEREMFLTLYNKSRTIMKGLAITAAVGRDEHSGEPVSTPVIDELGPGEDRTISIPISIDGPSIGGYVVSGRVIGLETAVAFSADTSNKPWGLVLIALTFALVAFQVRKLTQARSRRRAPSRQTVAKPVRASVDNTFDNIELFNPDLLELEELDDLDGLREISAEVDNDLEFERQLGRERVDR